MLLEQFIHRTRMLQRGVDLGIAIVAKLVIPTGLIVLAGFFVVARIQAVFEVEVFAHNEGKIGVVSYVLVLDLVVFQKVTNNAAQENDVGSGSRLDERRVGKGCVSK